MHCVGQDLAQSRAQVAQRASAEAPASRQPHVPGPAREPNPEAAAERELPTWREWGSWLLQICLVVGVELIDDLFRGTIAPRQLGPTQFHALQVMQFEQSHGFWVEPAMQLYFQRAHHLFGLALSWSSVVPLVNAVYGLAHGLVTVAFAIWIFWRRRSLYPFVRNVFLFTTALAVVIYNLYPLAPPRLATGLRYEGHPFHFVDTVFVGGGVNLSFDQYAAMPSLHVAWALIVGVTLAYTARHLVVRLLGLAHPLVMSEAVIVTGNHYIVDCLAGAAVALMGFILALLLSRWQGGPLPGRAAAGQPTLRASPERRAGAHPRGVSSASAVRCPSWQAPSGRT